MYSECAGVIQRVFVVVLLFGGWSGLARAVDGPQLTEILASNHGSIEDEEGDHPDWIEIQNVGPNAADLEGWWLTDDPTILAKWRFPAAPLPGNGFLLVFASGKDRAHAGLPLHANFTLDADGEYVALVRPDGVTVASEIRFPAQVPDVSYGPGQVVQRRWLLESNAPARWWVPVEPTPGEAWHTAEFDDSAWLSGVNGWGYEIPDAGLGVTFIQSRFSVTNLTMAETIVVTPTMISNVIYERRGVINYLGTGPAGRYGGDRPFPGTASTNINPDNFVLVATATVTIPVAGEWSFGVTSDAGFKLSIGDFVVSSNRVGNGETLGTFEFGAAGEYPLRLLVFDRLGGSGAELYAAPGRRTAFDGSVFRLVGDTNNGGLTLKSFALDASTAGYRERIRTDVESLMARQNSALYARLPFTLERARELTSLTLRVRADDGFAAWLNGQEVARGRAPDPVTWNSAATEPRANHQVAAGETFNLTTFLGALRDGPNVLALQGLNMAAGDADFFLSAELNEHQVASSTNQYFGVPTPGGLNGTDSFAFVANVEFSHTRGFHDTNFNLALTCPTPGAEIRFTTNGTVPTLTTGALYSGPLPIRRTTVLRAAGFRDGFEPSPVETHTFLFTADVVDPSRGATAPPGWPPSWGANAVDYGMDSNVVNHVRFRDQVQGALKAIPSFCLVVNLSDLFNPSSDPAIGGIYANPGQDGREWERPCSVERLTADAEEAIQSDAGLRIRGGYSRTTGNPKHAFRLLFRGEYGNPRFNFPVFGPDAAQSFDGFDLRTAQNYSWSLHHDARGVFVRDQYARDLQLAMGQPAERGDFCHLFINGVYWGLYDTCERPEASYGATYFGGRAEDYDVVKIEAGPYTVNATDGTLLAWSNLWRQAEMGLASDAAYQKAQGNHPDGTRNPAYAVLLDVDNLIAYNLTSFFTGNRDGARVPNNFYCLRNRNGQEGFRYFMHDSEHSLLDVNDDLTTDTGAGATFDKSNPQRLWQQCRANAEFRLRVADHVQRLFFNGGVLTSTNARERFLRRTSEIELAVVAESARWGDAQGEPPLTRDHWQAAVDDLADNYFPTRSAIVFRQLVAQGFYPTNVPAPRLQPHGGLVPAGYSLVLTNPAAAGTIFFTVNGSDPRQLGGAIAPGAQAYAEPVVILRQTQIRARVRNGTAWSALVEATFYPEQDFDHLRLTEIMYHPLPNGGVSGDELEFLELQNTGDQSLDLSGVRFSAGIEFVFTNGTSLEPGAFLVLARNPAQLIARYPGQAMAVYGPYSGRLDNAGETLTLSHPAGQTLWALAYGDTAPWPAVADGYGFSLVPRAVEADAEPRSGPSWRGSNRPGGSPGTDDPPPTTPQVVINEVLTASGVGQRDAVELVNLSNEPANIGGWFLTDDPKSPRKFRIPPDTLVPAGGYRVFDERDFNAPPETTNSFAFSANGDSVYLFAADLAGALTGYDHGVDFGAAAEGESFGRYVNSTGEEQFPAQRALSLGGANAGPRVGPVVISEILYHPDPVYDEFVEIQNISDEAVPLFDPADPARVWRLGGLDYLFPGNLTLQPGQRLVLTGVAPADFRRKYAVSEATLVLGPYPGGLQDSGERLQLQRPGRPDTNGIAYIVVDGVRYNDKAPWPPAADGGGPSLQRLELGAYGDDPINWFASGISPGRSNRTNAPPSVTILTPAAGYNTAAPADVLIEVQADDPDGGITQVEFYVGGVKLAEVTQAPFRVTWTNATTGSTWLTARATDNDFAFALSTPVPVTIHPAPPGTGFGLLCEVHDNVDFTGAKFSRIDPVVSNRWATVAPAPGIGADTFSVRWTGYIQPQVSGRFFFHTLSDDGVRLWVNGQNLVTNWTVHFETENTGAIDLAGGGMYLLRLEMYDNGGSATAILMWTTPDGTKELVPSRQLYPTLADTNAGPTVLVNPQPVTVASGSAARLDAFAVGNGPVHYQWFRGGEPLPGATEATLVVTNVQAVDDGVYHVTATDTVRTVLSGSALLRVLFRPVVLRDPQPQVALEGDTVTFDAVASGTAPMNYRWRRDGFPITNATNDVLVLPAVQIAQSGNYSAIIANAAGAVVTGSGALIVLADFDHDRMADVWEGIFGLATNNAADALLDGDGDGVMNRDEYAADTDPTDPQSRLWTGTLTFEGGVSSLQFQARSNHSYTVQFRESPGRGRWQTLAQVGARPTNWLANAQDSYPMTGQRFYRLVTPRLPESAPGPVILESPSTLVVDVGAEVELGVFAVGAGELSYQWEFNGTLLSGQTAAQLRISDVQTNAAGHYTVRIGDGTGSVTTEPARLTVLVRPMISEQPADQAVSAGAPARFEVRATGFSPLAYRWLRNGRMLAQETNAVLVISDARTEDAGVYSVLVSHATYAGRVGIRSRDTNLRVNP